MQCPTCKVDVPPGGICPSCGSPESAILTWRRSTLGLEQPHHAGAAQPIDPEEARLWSPHDGGPFSKRTMTWIRYGVPIALVIGAWILILAGR
jgi:hypothetical protein